MSLSLEDLNPLLELLKDVNPCNQELDFTNDANIISYSLKINIFNFTKLFPIHIQARIVGLPISISHKGYWGDVNTVKQLIHKKKGLKIVLNAEEDLGTSGRTLSTFIFNNRFKNFDDYLDAFRSSYRRRIKQALKYRSKLNIRKINKDEFTKNHYELYLSVMERTENPLEVLPMEFFINYDSQLYEFLNADSNELVGFIQLKQIDDCLYFFFGGFKKIDNEKYDLYYNMLIKIIEIGIKAGVETINFGQTAEESKLKIGCVEVPKYLYIHHSNIIINKALQLLAPLFSYKPYKIRHHVFKSDSKGIGL